MTASRQPRKLAMTTISRNEFERYRRFIPAVTKTGVMATYQLSQHSWYKLRDGKPVKLSVVHRLRDRFNALQAGIWRTDSRYGSARPAMLRRAEGAIHVALAGSTGGGVSHS